MAGSLIGAWVFLSQERIAERWNVWKFEHGGNAWKQEALYQLEGMDSPELIPLALRAMEESGLKKELGQTAAWLLVHCGRGWGENVTTRILRYAARSGSWDGARFMKAFKAIYPQWHGEFDQKGISRFILLLSKEWGPVE